MTDLLKEAIADAKAVRETALANAKAALEEAFTPRLQSMLSAKLSEEEEEDFDIDPEPAPAPAMEDEMALEGEYEEDPDETLEAIIRELDGEMEDEYEMEEELEPSDIGAGDNEVNDDLDIPTEEEDFDIDINEIIAALREEEGADVEEPPVEDEPVEESQYTAGVDDEGPALEEAYRVIRYLQSKINEVNLLNAKLLFSNKLFKNHSLNESQKMKVIESFDRAISMREVKLVYSTLSESFNLGKSKRQIKESRASKPAGRSTAPKKEILSENNALTARWKKLANIG